MSRQLVKYDKKESKQGKMKSVDQSKKEKIMCRIEMKGLDTVRCK